MSSEPASSDDDFVTLLDDEAPSAPEASLPRWKVAVIDDDPAVHEGTRYALSDYRLNGQGLKILTALSAREGRELIAANPDVAVILLDVVMETEDAGLALADAIRNELGNETARIILRTGQPGQAPERRVIVDYDINDYKAKTELTADKLFTTMTAALRAYQQLQRMVETRRGLEIIIDAASELFDLRSVQRLAEGVLTQIASLLNTECAGILVFRDERRSDTTFSILAGSGSYSHFINAEAGPALDPDTTELVWQAFRRRGHAFDGGRSVLYVRTGSGREIVVLLDAGRHLSATDRTLVEVFCGRLSVAFDNIALYEEIQSANAQLEARVAERTRELIQANERLASQRDQLRTANRFKNEILGTVAHDLKNPLSVILGRTEILTELLASKPSSLERAAQQVTHVRDSAKRLTNLIDRLIAEAMNDAAELALQNKPVDLTRLLAEVVEANVPLADRKRQTLALASTEALIVTADEDSLREAIDNLVSNAIKYSPAGGAIEIALEGSEKEARIAVRDHGPGFTEEDRARMFGRFQRLSASPTGGESSTGLGLSIAKHIVELHDGRIEATSDGPGTGATFAIRLKRPSSDASTLPPAEVIP